MPGDWVKHVDQWSGYELAHPAGWQVRNVRGSIVIAENPNGLVMAWISSVPFAGATSLQDFVTKYVASTHASDQTFETSPVTDPEPTPGTIVLRARSRYGASQLEGCMTFTFRDTNVVVRGFRAPVDGSSATNQTPPHSAELVEILNSFRTVPSVARQLFHEPKEGAFAVVVPMGWVTSGKVSRGMLSAMVTCEFSTQSDARGLTKVGVPGSFWSFMDSWLGTRFMPAGKFAAEWLPKKLALKDLRVERSEDWPDLLPFLYSEAARVGMGPSDLEITTARTTSTFDLANTRVRQHVFTATTRPRGAAAATSPLAGQWIGQLLSYYHAPEREFDSIQSVLAGIAGSFKLNPAWQQREAAKVAEEQMVSNMLFQQMMIQNQQAQQRFMQTQHAIWANQQHTSDSIMQTWEHKNAVQDHAMHQWSNATLGRTDVVDPSMGTVYSVQNNYDQYWHTNDGYIVGGSWGTQPDPSWQQLEPIKL